MGKGRQGVALVSETNATEGIEVAALECPLAVFDANSKLHKRIRN